MSNNPDYKATLNLPQTSFTMKADLPKREPIFLKEWLDKDIYKLISVKSKGKRKYILHDGPPYANGNIHIGHVLNKTLKDIVVKYKTMQGFDSAYVPGWDCHGLPIEHQLFKELKMNKYQINRQDFRKKAYSYALRYVEIQKEEFIRLGVFGDWQDPYLTLEPHYEEAILDSFAELVKQGYVYRGLKPVNWCFKCETALAEAEVEYEEHVTASVCVKFKIEDTKGYNADTYLLIWTTTPWTLIANVAVAAHPEFTYSYIRTDKGNLILAGSLLSGVLAGAGIDKYELIREIKGKDLEGLTYTHPFGLRKGRVVLADYVCREEGTGLVHTAPGHGSEDYATGLKYKLEVVMPVDAKGNFDATAGEFKGLNVYDANKAIIDKLKNLGLLFFAAELQHSYPHCWRCKTPIIFRATKQWFLSLEHKDLRKKLLHAINQDVRWIPASGRERIAAMVELRPDWCLSRQRYWGVPIPALICKDCGEEFLDAGLIKNFSLKVAKEGTDIWFERDLKEFSGANIRCPHCKGKNFSKGTDILDVWFDSGVSYRAVLKKREELEFPCALYLEGSDQHRGWFQSSLIPSICIDSQAPFKAVLTHGHVVDDQGRKMSKSLGNVTAPQDIIKDYGADILRLWVASSDYNEDIRISPEIVARLAEAYRKIRNTARFILSNLYDFEPDTAKLTENDLKRVDRWILREANVLLQKVREAYDSFVFYQAYKLIYDFCNQDLSMGYLDMVKGRLYTCAANSAERRAAQTAIYEVLNLLVRVMAPILAFTAEEIWQNMPKGKKDNSITSVHLLDWPQHREIKITKEISDFDLSIVEYRPYVAKVLEEKRSQGLIGSSFDSRIKILTNKQDRYTLLKSLGYDLCEIFKVSGVAVDFAANNPEISVEVFKAQGSKCVRCWNYSAQVGASSEHPLICEKCLKAIGGR